MNGTKWTRRITRSQASGLVLNFCADTISAMAYDLCMVDPAFDGLDERSQELVAFQALALAKSLRARAAELEQGSTTRPLPVAPTPDIAPPAPGPEVMTEARIRASMRVKQTPPDSDACPRCGATRLPAPFEDPEETGYQLSCLLCGETKLFPQHPLASDRDARKLFDDTRPRAGRPPGVRT